MKYLTEQEFNSSANSTLLDALKDEYYFKLKTLPDTKDAREILRQAKDEIDKLESQN